MIKRYHGRPAILGSITTCAAGAGLRRIGALLFLMLGMGLNAKAQTKATAPFFRSDSEARSAAAVSRLSAALFRSQALTVDVAGLRGALAAAPLEAQAGAAPLVVVLPLPNGGTGRFAVRHSSVLAPALAARFPEIKTYAGVGLDDATASVRLDITPQGFHAQVLTGTGNSFYIDPVAPTDTRHYLGFYKRDMKRGVGTLACGFQPTAANKSATAAQRKTAQASAAARLAASGSLLRTYRLALACTPEYALTKGNTVASVLAAEVTTVNRVVGVYERELTVRMVLVPNNDQLVFLSRTGPQPSPPYTDNNGEAMLAQNQTNIDRIIGDANYDIGHVVSTNGGGVAFLGVVCVPSRKAQGVTGLANPVGDAFDIDFVAHEMGHQFGGNHTFNGVGGNCAGNRNPGTAWEPGSGSTIMAYAGICGPADNLQPNSDAVFHTGSYEEIRAFVDGTTCGTDLATGNTPPAVTILRTVRTLPTGTPFKLTATATDAQNDAITYSWEELDRGRPGPPTAAQNPGDNVPLFRSFTPSPSGTRYFPRLSDLLGNISSRDEQLPTVTRQLNFRCTVRDEHNGPAGVAGGVDFSPTLRLNVSSTAGPFEVTAPNTAVSWTGGTAQTITWAVANTTAPPVSCALVNLRLSLDGGLTYPVVLALNEPNDGTAVVAAPNVSSGQARLMVESVDNYFFDISNINFNIAPVPTPTISSFSPAGGLPGTVVILTGTNFAGATALRFNGTAAASFTVNSATQITATVAVGTATGAITVTGPTGTGTSATPFVVGSPPVVSGFTPGTAAVGSPVVLTGVNFTDVRTVQFNGTFAPVFTVNSATQITVTVPPGATTGPIAVTTATGTGVSAGSFVVIPAPVITSFTPTAGPAGTVVVLTGSNFNGTTQVTFNGVVAPTFTVNSATQITVTVPAGAASGPIVVTAAGGSGVSETNFLVPPANDLCLNALPLACGQTVTGSTASATATGDPVDDCFETIDAGGVFYTVVGNGRPITISTCSPNTDFDTKLFVYSGVCGTLTCIAGNDDDPTCTTNGMASTITFNTTAGTSYTVFVSGFDTETGSFSLSATCSTAPVPVVTSLSPTNGPVGTAVTLTGTDFTGASSVTLNGVPVTGLTVLSATTITFTVPAGATTGDVVVTTPAGISNAQVFTVGTITAAANSTKSEFSIWPNPVAGKGLLYIKLAVRATQATITLRNVVGQLVSTRNFSGTDTELSMAGLAAGTYLLSVQMDGRAPSVRRVVVE